MYGEAADYRERRYLSAVEAAQFLGVSASVVHQLVAEGVLRASIAASGQYRFDLKDLQVVRAQLDAAPPEATPLQCEYTLFLNQTVQRI